MPWTQSESLEGLLRRIQVNWTLNNEHERIVQVGVHWPHSDRQRVIGNLKNHEPGQVKHHLGRETPSQLRGNKPVEAALPLSNVAMP